MFLTIKVLPIFENAGYYFYAGNLHTWGISRDISKGTKDFLTHKFSCVDAGLTQMITGQNADAGLTFFRHSGIY
jgi:hypothetical protein